MIRWILKNLRGITPGGPPVLQISRHVAEGNKAMLEKELVRAGFDLNAPMMVEEVNRHVVKYTQPGEAI